MAYVGLFYLIFFYTVIIPTTSIKKYIYINEKIKKTPTKKQAKTPKRRKRIKE